MSPARDWSHLITPIMAALWPALPNGPKWIAAQVEVESAGDPMATSPVGAMGLLQLMPLTARELHVEDPYDPEENLRAGVTYLKRQYDRFPEIPSHDDRVKWSLGAYNMGRGWCNKALALAREEEPGLWWRWDTGKYWLMHRKCRNDAGQFPDHLQAWHYVARIVGRVDPTTHSPKE